MRWEIDDNTIKASIKRPLENTCFDPHHIRDCNEDIPPPLGDTCFDPHFSPYGIKSPKKPLQNNIAQSEKLVVQGVSSMSHDPIMISMKIPIEKSLRWITKT